MKPESNHFCWLTFDISGNHLWPRAVNGERFEELPKPYDISAVLSATVRLLNP
ncbi:MAG: hypothetical protein AAF488_00450 [Planctomycetota bacterium]